MRRIFNSHSIIIGFALALYFLAMDQLGLAENIELRLFNGLIIGAGLWMYFSRRSAKGEFEGVKYLRGLKDGLAITVGATLTFTALFVIYTGLVSPEFIEAMQSKMIIPDFFRIWHFAAMILFEGVASGFVVSLLLMQYYKHEPDSQSRNPVAA